MFRKLSVALAVSAALSSTGALALGLGEISTNSALNENFNADIELVSVNLDEVEGIKASLASAADFARKGMDRPFLLSKLRFNTVVLDDGRVVIQITTKGSVREPFLNFLVEVNWPKGRLVREFTVLLDPPVTLDREPPLIMPVVSAPAETEGIPEPRVGQYAAVGERYIPTPVGGEPPETTAEKYGPVPKGMTLWRIAKKMDVAGASIQQVIEALFRSNPSAFIDNDVNKLRAGVMLRLPAWETAISQSPQQARADSRTKTQSRKEPQDAQADRMRIATVPTEAAAGTDIERVKTDLMLVRETGETTRQETEELRSRIHELEAQLTDIRQLLKLKSDQLAALQAVPVEPGEEMASVTPETEVKARSGAVEESEPLLPKEAVAPEPAEPVVETSAEPEPAAVVEPAPQAEPKPQPLQLPAKAVPPPTEVAPALPASEPGLMDRLLSDTTLLGIVAAVALVLLSLVWLLIRRRRETEGQFDETALLAPSESTTVQLEKGSEVTESLDQEEATSFISDFSPSDIDALQEETGEVDPAAEADVYIAYGRYQQAESLISQSIEKAPDRLDLKLKLLEIYFTTRNVASYTALAEQLESAGAPKKDPQLWERVLSMGRELAPDHELFGTPEPGKTPKAPVAAIGGGEEEKLATDSEALAGLDLDLDTELSELKDEPPPGYGEGAVLEPPQMADPEVAAGGDAKRAVERAVGLDTEEENSEFAIDLSDLDSLEDIDLSDLGMDSEALGTGQAGQPAIAVPESADKLNEREPTNAVVAESAAVADELEFELSQFNLDEPTTGELDGGEPLSEMTEPVAGGGQDSETKLDLARVYLEMGDTEGASEFLEEVLQEGSEEQKTAAKALLDNLS